MKTDFYFLFAKEKNNVTPAQNNALHGYESRKTGYLRNVKGFYAK